jgi:hypothetical protein
MAIYPGKYYQELVPVNEGATTYKIWSPIYADNFFFLEKTGDPLAKNFNHGDVLTLINGGSSYSGDTYEGSFEGNLILKSGNKLILFTNNPYPYPSEPLIITIDRTTPFPVCFVKGTLITTSRGPVAIEDLIEGDTVQGSTGWRTVKWVGWRKYGANAFKTEESISRIAPVRIRAHAIADNVPSSDLLTSPWHHLFVDGKLVRAGDLINGTTITQETHVTEVSYYHVELDQFDVIMAHGIYSESWADGGNRNFFQNVDVTSLRPEDMKRRRASRPGFDHLVLRQGKALASIQDHVAQRALAIISTEANKQKVA